ncbi:axotactin isoform X2 [Anabrus simplex]|uniref:axotactin isoform X2 n=1 Tax=Anabrus simplex TaxID=316456 RepID=UPI0034DD3B1A
MKRNIALKAACLLLLAHGLTASSIDEQSQYNVHTTEREHKTEKQHVTVAHVGATKGRAARDAAAAPATTKTVPKEERGVELTFNETGHKKTFMFAKSNTFIQLDGDEIITFQLRLCREISFQFRTRLPHGLLVYHSVKGRPEGMDPYALYVIVEKGQLKVLHVFGKQSTSLTLGDALNGDTWHSVMVRIDVHRARLIAKVDDIQKDTQLLGLDEESNYGVNAELSSVVLIGGLSPEEKLHGVKYIIESFVGCIKNMVLSTGKSASEMLPLNPLIATKHENVVEGCINKCKTRDNLCFVGSKCINHYSSYTCDCFGTRYEGELCDVYTATTLTLRGSSYVSYRVYDWKDRVHSSSNRISMYFKTRYDDSALFYASGEPGQHYIAVSLMNGTVHVRVKIGETTANVTIGDMITANYWNNLTISHYNTIMRIHFNEEAKEIDLQGPNAYLYIDPEIYIGGGPELHKKEGLVSNNNFAGSLKYVFFNDISILYELKKGNPKVHYIGVLEPEFYEGDVEVIPLTFPFPSSNIWWPLKQKDNLSLVFDFKSNRSMAVLASTEVMKETEKGYWEVRLVTDEVRFEVIPDVTKNTTKLITVKFDTRSAWHRVELEYSEGKMKLTVDHRSKDAKTMEIQFQFGEKIILGMGTKNNMGLIGCMRDIVVNGEHIEPRWVVRSKYALKDVSVDNCQLVDPCKRPNACEHGGKCSVQGDQVVCDCKGTDYIGKNCHFAQFRKTCEELALLGYTKPDTYLIDIDGNGVFPPAHVKCEFQSFEDSTKTIVEHNLPSQVDVRGSLQEDFSYSIQYREFTPEMLQELISHSLHCSQFIKYDCYKAPLELHSATWFLSSAGEDIVDYIGNVKRGACPCAVNKTCMNPTQTCNCDDISEAKWISDEGYFTSPNSLGITEMYFLQQKELIGDALGRITLGPLECVETNTQKYVVTFTSSQSYIEVPGWRKGDISFSFRTTGEKAILLYQPPIRLHHPSFMVALTSDFQLTFNFTLNTGRTHELEIKSRRRLNSGEWQKIWIDYNEHHVRFTINTDYQMVDLQPEEEFGPFEGSMFIGGATEELLKELSVRQGLIGCFRGLVVNGEILDIYSYMSVHLSEIIKDCKPSCDPNPCKNGAKCKELWSSFQCVCQNPWAHVGVHCETNINTKGLTFLNPKTFLKKNLLATDTGTSDDKAILSRLLNDNILINLRTYDENALVFYANDHLNNFVQLEIREGKNVVFLFNSGNEIINITVEHPALNSGKSIQVAIIRNEEETILHVNKKNMSVQANISLLTEYSNKPWINPEKEVLAPQRPPVPPTPYFQFNLGGYDPYTLIPDSIPGYVGCIRGLKIGDQLVDLPAKFSETAIGDETGIREGCKMKCDTEPCKNQGICIEDFGKGESTCNCEHTSYYGEFCSEEKGAEFGGESMIQRKYNPEGPVTRVKVQLAFSSNDEADKRTLLLLLQTSTEINYYLLIALANGGKELIFEEDRNGTTYRATVPNRNFFNGARHSVYYNRSDDTAVLLIDRERVAVNPVLVMQSGVDAASEVTDQRVNEVRIGGPSANDSRFTSYKGFNGCLSNVFVEVNSQVMKPVEEYMLFTKADSEKVEVTNAPGVRIAQCAVFDVIHKPRPGPSLNISLGRNKEWNVDPPKRIPYKSLYSDSSTEEDGSSKIIFLVMTCIFVLIILGALCEVYRTHRKHKRRMEQEAEAAIMWPKPQGANFQDPVLNPSIKMTGYKPIPTQDKAKPQYNGSQAKPITKNDYKQIPSSPPVDDPVQTPTKNGDRKRDSVNATDRELEWDPMPDNTELILDKSLEDLSPNLPNNKPENGKGKFDENDIPSKPVYSHKNNHTLPYSIDELGSIEFTTTPYA